MGVTIDIKFHKKVKSKNEKLNEFHIIETFSDYQELLHDDNQLYLTISRGKYNYISKKYIFENVNDIYIDICHNYGTNIDFRTDENKLLKKFFHLIWNTWIDNGIDTYDYVIFDFTY
jgi:hypothetical protein